MTNSPIFSEGKVILIDKPMGWSSFQVVNKIRYLIKRYEDKKNIKVGHAGTLDPLATGLLILCSGKMTKEINTFQGQEKEYVAQISFGATTPSYDLETQPENHRDVSQLTLDKVMQHLRAFEGDILQVPPIFSAIQVDGQRAYEAARKGKDIALKARQITISELEILKSTFTPEKAQISLRIVCSKGTYIRSLAHDLGQAVGTGAHLSGLRRTRIGDFSVQEAQTIDEFAQMYAVKKSNKEI